MFNQQIHDCYTSPVSINCRSVGQSSRRISSGIDENMENLEQPSSSNAKEVPAKGIKKFKFFKDSKPDVLAELQK